ncbi:histidine kinase [Sphaerochaeta pleomorpha str. Grapes]|uniref:Histidine kinase n=1 Tax=Sphaerochaeta pleomorpha (strain ATCC BAA-1885 / DSM 22778 / Grapes) TaxID=158190 RepID=G8QWC8_SPHPG|nr:histidine kinase [Sphaerochaeta pleomorpha]AEV29426.1 histidine kinase [Sphaerochaeta pleomorpha str. Grapes]
MSTIMVVSFCFLFSIVLAISTLMISLSVRKSLIQSVFESNTKIMNESVGKIDTLNDIITSVSFYVAGDSRLKQMLKQFPEDQLSQIPLQNEVRYYLTQLWMNRPEIVGISIYLEGISEVNHSTVGVSSLSFAQKYDWLETLGNNRGIIINLPNPVTRGNVVFNSLSLVKILDDNLLPLGYLSFEISAKKVFSQCLEPALASKNSILFAINDDQVIVNHANLDLIGESVASLYPHYNPNGQPALKPIRFKGKQYIQIISKPSKLRWSIVQLIPLDDVFQFKPLLYSFVLLTLAAIALSAGMIFLLSERLTKPLTMLSQAMGSTKPLQATLSKKFLERQNEIGNLYRSYGEMTVRINELFTQLQNSMENQKKLEISALRAQINPHFMYNCLDYINWMAQDEHVPEISRMLTNLSRFMRISLTESNLTCPLSSEVEHVKTYLEIFIVRYKGAFTYEIAVAPELCEVSVPQFILQPLVENSMIHGFGKHFGRAHIKISIQKQEGWIVFDIIDNGIGMDQKKLEEVLSGSHEGSSEHGMKNINDRIRYAISPSLFSGIQLVPSQRGTHIHFALQRTGKSHG